MFVACKLPTKTIQKLKHPSPHLYVFCFAVEAQIAELTWIPQRKSRSFCQSLPICKCLVLSCQQAKMHCGFQSTEKCCILSLPSPLPAFYLFHTIQTDGVIYSNRLRPTFLIALLLIRSSYFLNVKRKGQILGTEGTHDVAAEAGKCSW